jgi:hypothetical protein
MTTVHTVFIQVEAPKGDYQGKLAEGCYIVESDTVKLTNRRGVPVQDDDGKRYEQKLEGNNPKWVAGQLTKQFRKVLRGPNAPPRGFGSPIRYPKSWNSIA